MFRSEEQKMQLYRSNLGREAKNQFKQGEALDEFLLYEKGIETQEKGRSKFAEAIGEQIGKNMRTVMPTDRIKAWAASKATNDSLDDNITATSKNKPKSIAQQKSDDIIRPKSKGAPRSIKQPPQPKDLFVINNQRENDLMDIEDINMNTLVPKSKPATAAEITAQNDAQANLDLIALFQQDVKEGRKRQALKDLAQLSVDEDRRLRENFMNALEDMMDEVNNRSAAAKAKKQYKEDKMVLDKMMRLIENQRMHDSFMEFSNIAMRDQFANKLQRNLKSALNYKKSMYLVNNYLKKEIDQISNATTAKLSNIQPYENQMQRRNELESRTRNKAATTIQQRMAELRARKAAKRRSSDDGTEATSIMSDAPQKIDQRQFNPGRHMNPNLPTERLIGFQLLEQRKANGEKLSREEKKKMTNLQGQLFRKPMGLEDKPIHRPQAGRNYKK